MKHPLKTISLLTASALLSLSSLTAVETDPVGYVTLTIHGNATNTRNFVPVAAQLVKAPIIQVSPSSVSGGDLIFDGTPLDSVDMSATDSEGAASHYMEIVEPEALAGQIIDVISNSANSVVTADPSLDSLLDSDSVVLFREYLEIQDVFGPENETGLTSGQDAETSDTIRISDSNGILRSYYYQTDDLGFLGGNGWRKDGDNTTDHSTRRIAPDQAVVVSRLPGGNTLSRVVAGSVKMNSLPTPLAAGLNTINSPFPVDVTLGASGLYSEVPGEGIAGGSDVDSADIVYIYNPSLDNTADARLEKYYYQIDELGFLGGTGWRKDGDVVTDQSGKIISSSTGVIVAIESGTSIQVPTPFASNQ